VIGIDYNNENKKTEALSRGWKHVDILRGKRNCQPFLLAIFLINLKLFKIHITIM
jgi:hypothetical protein